MLGVFLELISAHSGRYEAIVVSFSGDISFAVCFLGGYLVRNFKKWVNPTYYSISEDVLHYCGLILVLHFITEHGHCHYDCLTVENLHYVQLLFWLL